MRTVGLLSALAMILVFSWAGPSQASSYGCSQEKCIATCSKVGGRIARCQGWCSAQIAKDPKCNKK